MTGGSQVRARAHAYTRHSFHDTKLEDPKGYALALYSDFDAKRVGNYEIILQHVRGGCRLTLGRMQLHELVVLTKPHLLTLRLSWGLQSGDPDIHNGLSATYKRAINMHLPGPFRGSGCSLFVGSTMKLNSTCPTSLVHAADNCRSAR